MFNSGWRCGRGYWDCLRFSDSGVSADLDLREFVRSYRLWDLLTGLFFLIDSICYTFSSNVREAWLASGI